MSIGLWRKGAEFDGGEVGSTGASAARNDCLFKPKSDGDPARNTRYAPEKMLFTLTLSSGMNEVAARKTNIPRASEH